MPSRSSASRRRDYTDRQRDIRERKKEGHPTVRFRHDTKQPEVSQSTRRTRSARMLEEKTVHQDRPPEETSEAETEALDFGISRADVNALRQICGQTSLAAAPEVTRVRTQKNPKKLSKTDGEKAFNALFSRLKSELFAHWQLKGQNEQKNLKAPASTPATKKKKRKVSPPIAFKCAPILHAFELKLTSVCCVYLVCIFCVSYVCLVCVQDKASADASADTEPEEGSEDSEQKAVKQIIRMGPKGFKRSRVDLPIQEE